MLKVRENPFTHPLFCVRSLLRTPHKEGSHGRKPQDHGCRSNHCFVSPSPLRGPLHQGGPLGLDGPIFQETPQIVRQFVGRSVACLGSLLHGLQHNRLQLTRNRLVLLAGRARLFKRDLPQQLFAVQAREGVFQREQLVQRHAERVNIRAMVHQKPLGQCLFRAHIAKRTYEVAGHR